MARPSIALSAGRIRELARAGAEATLKELRAEIIAIERTFPELALAKEATCATTLGYRSGNQDEEDVSRSAERGLVADEKDLTERRKAKKKMK